MYPPHAHSVWTRTHRHYYLSTRTCIWTRHNMPIRQHTLPHTTHTTHTHSLPSLTPHTLTPLPHTTHTPHTPTPLPHTTHTPHTPTPHTAQIQLYTASGSLRDTSDCAPNIGYYLIPSYDKVSSAITKLLWLKHCPSHFNAPNTRNSILIEIRAFPLLV